MGNNKFGNRTNRNFANPTNSNKFGDFEEIKQIIKKQDSSGKIGEEEEEFVRVKIPDSGQIVGKVVQRLGGNRMEVACNDRKTRNCRVPGRFKRRFWLRQGDFVLIEVWPDDDNKGDIVFQYKKGSGEQLRKKGLINGIGEGF